MESSLRSCKNRTKLYKMKNSFDSYFLQCQEALKNKSTITFQKNDSTKNSLIQSFVDSGNCFSSNGSSLAFQVNFPKKIFDSKEFSDKSLYEPLSFSQKFNQRFKIKTGRALSYKYQREKSTIKTEVALKDLQQINQFKINQFQHANNTIGFNQELSQSKQMSAFQPYATIRADRPMSIRSPSKSRHFIIKRAKSSPKKLRIGLSPFKSSKKNAAFRIKECQNISSQKLLCAPPLLQKKQSISAWQTKDQAY